MKKILDFIKLKRSLEKRMVAIDETMDLCEMADVYAEYLCRKNGWQKNIGSGMLSGEFCEISLSFVNGYIKALHDNNLEFQKGLVKKRDITHDMPSGALDHYMMDRISETKKKAIEALQKVMNEYEDSKTNINTIVNAFKKEIEKL